MIKCRDMVGVEYAGVHIISCYISPNAPHSEFLSFVDDLCMVIRQLGKHIIICGDFNSKSVFWGCRTDTRGRLIEEWAAENDMRLINTGNIPTCVRPQGCSVVDLTWCTPDTLGRLSGWTVRSDMESLSDHSYTVMRLSCGAAVRSDGPHRVGWCWRTMDVDIFRAAIYWEMPQPSLREANNIDDKVKMIEKAFQHACDAAMERVRFGPRKRPVYWWNEAVALARRASI